MALTDIYDAAVPADSRLRKQIAAAVHKAAVDVRNEATNTANHARRLTWADKVLNNPDGPAFWAGVFVWGVLENATIVASPGAATDNDVQFVVNSLIDRYAGA